MWRIPETTFPTTSQNSVVSLAASFIATAILIRTVTTDLVPVSLTDYLNSRIRNFTTWLSSNITVVIDEFDGLSPNQIFESATVYLGSKLSTSAARIKASKPHKENEIAFTVDKDQELVDFFQGVKINWILFSSQIENSGAGGGKKEGSRPEVRYFELSFRKKYKDLVLRFYLPYIVERANMVKNENKTVKLYTVDYNGTDYWSWVNLNHPASFDTIAIDSGMKRELIEDLDLFVERKEYYKRVGRAWKRGYLFYGPPGTGKSSLVAAMANYLKFDVYDLDLREVQCNSDLRRLLIGTANRSILVIEDIDCSIELQNRESTSEVVSIPDEKVTLSGLLNFIDGLWSSCGDERIIVFTTNHKDRLDPALLRPGRMDMQFHLSYCSFHGFKTLAYSYLKIEDHSLFRCIEELLGRVQATPAEIAGELMKGKNAELTLQGLIKFLQSRGDEVSLQKKTSSTIENN